MEKNKFRNRYIRQWIYFFAYAIFCNFILYRALKTEPKEMLPLVYIMVGYCILTYILMPVLLFSLKAMHNELFPEE